MESPIDLNQFKDDDDEKDLSISPLYENPSLVLLGQAGIVKHHVLNNRFHILTQDSSNNIALWDVLRANKIRDIGIADWEETITSHFQFLSIPQWFRVDHTTGVSLHFFLI